MSEEEKKQVLGNVMKRDHILDSRHHTGHADQTIHATKTDTDSP